MGLIAASSQIQAVQNGQMGLFQNPNSGNLAVLGTGQLSPSGLMGSAWGMRRSEPPAQRFKPMPGVDGKALKRMYDGGDLGTMLSLLTASGADLQRAITTQTTGFPVRENLEGEASILVPLDTPMRNRIPRIMGAGVAAQWRQLVSLGGGYAGASTTTGALTAGVTVVIPMVSVAGIVVGDMVAIDTGAAQEIRIVSAVTPATPSITVSVAPTAGHASGVVVAKYMVQPGSSQTGAVQAFYSETGAPGVHTSIYAPQSLGYKLLGTIGSVSGFAMAAGANFQNQLAIEKRDAIWNLMLNEENALINANASSVLAPWGDGTSAWAYNGLIPSITTANGVPADQVQTAVGALSTSFIDSMLRKLWTQGARNMWILTGAQELLSLTHLAEAPGNNPIRVNVSSSTGDTVMGLKVTGYVNPITGEIIPILASRFVAPGTMVFGCDNLPDGKPAIQVDVLPQVQLPALAPNANVQGYVAQDIAPTAAAPQVYPFIVSLFSVLKLKSFVHFGIGTGITAV